MICPAVSETLQLVRAREWENKGRNAGRLLLSDEEFNPANEWLRTSRDKHPEPTELHSEYILASELERERRHRFQFRLAVVIILFLAGLAIVAIWQAILADQNAEEARRNEEEALKQTRLTNNQLQTLALVNSSEIQVLGKDPKPPFLLGLDLWVVTAEGVIWQLRADTAEPRAKPLDIGGNLYEPVFDGKYLWIGSSDGDTLTRILPGTPATSDTIKVPSSLVPPLITEPNRIWVLAGSSLIPVDRETLEVGDEIRVGRNPKFPLYDGTYIWTIDSLRSELYRTHAETGEAKSIEIGEELLEPVFAGGTIWITDALDGQVYQVDPDSLTVIQQLAIGDIVNAPILRGDWLWITTSIETEIGFEHYIVQIDPQTSDILNRPPVQTPIRALYIHANRLWAFENGPNIISFDLTNLSSESTADFTIKAVGAYRLSAPVFLRDTMWIADGGSTIIYVVQLADGEIVRRLPHCAAPTQPVFDGTNMWVVCQVADTDQDTLMRIPALFDYHGAASGLVQFTENYQAYPPMIINDHLWVMRKDEGQLVIYDMAELPIKPEPLVYD